MGVKFEMGEKMAMSAPHRFIGHPPRCDLTLR